MENKRQIYFVTGNDNKAREAAEILGVDVVRASVELDEFQGMDLAVITEHKVRQAYERVRQTVLVEDVGLYINQWNGFPGPFIKWMGQTVGYGNIPKLMLGADRSVEWRTVYGLYDGATFSVFTGAVKGTIAHEARGSDGWGFDPIFIPDGQIKTYAELGSVEKVKISARTQALLKVKEFLMK